MISVNCPCCGKSFPYREHHNVTDCLHRVRRQTQQLEQAQILRQGCGSHEPNRGGEYEDTNKFG